MTNEYLNPVNLEELNNITLMKRTGRQNSGSKYLSFKTIDAALISLRGDIWVSECLLVVTPEKDSSDTSNMFEVHGIDKIYKRFLGTVFLSRADLQRFHENGTFDNYSMIFIKTNVNPRTCLEFLVSHCGDPDEYGVGNSVVSRRKKRNCPLSKQMSEPTIHELIDRLKACPKNPSDLDKFFDLAEEYNFAITIRPDFINCSNKLILDCFIFKTDFVGSLILSIREISDQIDKHLGLIKNLVIVEDTNELIMPRKVANFIRRIASLLNLLYVYDFVSEFIYKLVHNI